MPMENEPSAEILKLADSLRDRGNSIRRWEIWSIVAGIALSSGVTLVGILGKPLCSIQPHQLAGILGVLLTAVLTINRAFGFAERVASSRTLEAEARNLADDLSISLEERQKTFAVLRLKVAQSRAGDGLKAVETKKSADPN